MVLPSLATRGGPPSPPGRSLPPALHRLGPTTKTFRATAAVGTAEGGSDDRSDNTVVDDRARNCAVRPQRGRVCVGARHDRQDLRADRRRHRPAAGRDHRREGRAERLHLRRRQRRATARSISSGLRPATYEITVSLPQYKPQTRTVQVLLGQTVTANFKIGPDVVYTEAVQVVAIVAAGRDADVPGRAPASRPSRSGSCRRTSATSSTSPRSRRARACRMTRRASR